MTEHDSNTLLKDAIQSMDIEAVQRACLDNTNWTISNPNENPQRVAYGWNTLNHKQESTIDSISFWLQTHQLWINNPHKLQLNIFTRASQYHRHPTHDEYIKYSFSIFKCLVDSGAPILVDSPCNPLHLAFQYSQESAIHYMLEHEPECVTFYEKQKAHQVNLSLFSGQTRFNHLWNLPMKHQRIAQTIFRTQHIDWLNGAPLFNGCTQKNIDFLLKHGAVDEALSLMKQGGFCSEIKTNIIGNYVSCVAYNKLKHIPKLLKNTIPFQDGEREQALHLAWTTMGSTSFKKLYSLFYGQTALSAEILSELLRITLRAPKDLPVLTNHDFQQLIRFLFERKNPERTTNDWHGDIKMTNMNQDRYLFIEHLREREGLEPPPIALTAKRARL